MEKKTNNFEEKLSKLKEIISRIQNNELPLDESLKLYEEGNSIIKELEKELKDAEEKVETIIQTNK